MKLGILTLHSQLNYGGVLQCWALYSFLKSSGHEVIVLNHWMVPDASNLKGIFVSKSKRAWLNFFVDGLSFCGSFRRQARMFKTQRFLRNEIKTTPWSFFRWTTVPASAVADFDLIIVGSDQVWNGGNPSDVIPYLLFDYPAQTRAIAYAPSFGMSSLNAELSNIFQRGLRRFDLLSARERDGCEIIRRLGYECQKVVDPVLLIDEKFWQTKVGGARKRSCRRRLVCYFMDIGVEQNRARLARFAHAGWTIEIFVDKYFLPRPRRFKTLLGNFVRLLRAQFSAVRICLAGSPVDFVSALASADAVISDSFHALLFSAIFQKNVRIIRPTAPFRLSMFSRISEFVSMAMFGHVIVNDLDEAIGSIFNGERVRYDVNKIEKVREESQKWLNNAIGGGR